MTAAQPVTRSQVEAALARLDAVNHDDANLLKAVIQRLENQARQLAAALDKKEKDLGG